MKLELPSDARSVPLARTVLGQTLDALGVIRDCRADIELAITEACTNVLAHAADNRDYEVIIGISDDTCTIEVVDNSFRPQSTPQPAAGGVLIDANSEGGRGLQLMRALVDTLDFEVHPDDGTTVRMCKALVYATRDVA
jgi:serine/threonine-protein kinase RsbW